MNYNVGMIIFIEGCIMYVAIVHVHNYVYYAYIIR